MIDKTEYCADELNIMRIYIEAGIQNLKNHFNIIVFEYFYIRIIIIY